MQTAPISRALARIVTTPPPAPGFIGEGHTAVEVFAPDHLAASDPFVLLMDDRLEIPQQRQIGGAHPHAGLETVTFVLEGELHDRDEGTLRAGDVLWMNAGRGVIHNESVQAQGRSRILQLWVRLPAADRSSPPSFQLLREAEAPRYSDAGALVRLYSGSLGELRSEIRNHAPVTMADVRLRPGGRIAQSLPASYNGFLYVLDGVVRVGPGNQTLAAGQVGWLDRPGEDGDSVLQLRAPSGPARLVLYAGQPQNEPLVHRGPFVAGSAQEIAGLYHAFRSGRFELLSQVAARQRAAQVLERGSGHSAP